MKITPTNPPIAISPSSSSSKGTNDDKSLIVTVTVVASLALSGLSVFAIMRYYQKKLTTVSHQLDTESKKSTEIAKNLEEVRKTNQDKIDSLEVAMRQLKEESEKRLVEIADGQSIASSSGELQEVTRENLAALEQQESMYQDSMQPLRSYDRRYSSYDLESQVSHSESIQTTMPSFENQHHLSIIPQIFILKSEGKDAPDFLKSRNLSKVEEWSYKQILWSHRTRSSTLCSYKFGKGLDTVDFTLEVKKNHPSNSKDLEFTCNFIPCDDAHFPSPEDQRKIQELFESALFTTMSEKAHVFRRGMRASNSCLALECTF